MKKILATILILTLLTIQLLVTTPPPLTAKSSPIIPSPINTYTERKPIEDLILIPDTDPYFGIIGAALACWYTPSNTSGLIPLLIHHNNTLQPNQQRFLHQYLNSTSTILSLGTTCTTNYSGTTLPGNPPEVAIAAAYHTFTQASTALLLPYSPSKYQLNLQASPIASYHNIPPLLYANNTEEINITLQNLNITTVILIGGINPNLQNIQKIHLPTEQAIQTYIIDLISSKFGKIHYLTITNPADTIPPITQNHNKTIQTVMLENQQLTLLGKTITLSGTDTYQHIFNLPTGLQQIHVTITATPKKTIWSYLFSDHPILYLTLLDPHQNTVAYSSSFANQPQLAEITTVAYHHPGNYTIKIKAYHGFKGGYFSLRGISRLNVKITINCNITQRTSAHDPLIPNLSILAPYLTAAHGGLILANSSYSLTDTPYADLAIGTAAGPWYSESLQNYSNMKVRLILSHLNKTLNNLATNGLLESFLNGPAWLALLGDSNMIPQYYYGPSQPGLTEKGLPSDNPYGLNNTLSIGRIIGWNISDVSVLLSRTFFYKHIVGQPSDSSWHNRFSFIFGEGFGETGGLFHQIPYALKLQKNGFDARVYGDLRNSRQLTTLLKAYTGANYIEYLGHGDWFWYTPSLYGLDFYNTAIDVAHVRNWIFPKPSLYLSSACLMGRIDGIPPTQSIGLTMLHAGCNAFIGATRETGSEAGLETLEDHLIFDDWSIGEALRGEKKIDQELPTYYVRTLYGDPAFNPYDPIHGFSPQGRPIE
ncbi:MAG: hypothetical protein KKC68_06060 [Candidatus Thermoplasmatota archaeon]|nr:hypothetical protein [Candidatus Thermoplasmatota archaeon]MBU1941321.1 hypothetical protein [Candidatus Thermoplasmatota archaeon]